MNDESHYSSIMNYEEIQVLGRRREPGNRLAIKRRNNSMARPSGWNDDEAHSLAGVRVCLTEQLDDL